jgi:hypothetical protein
MFRILLYAFLLWMGWQFIFNFLVPVIRTTRQIKKGFRHMQNKMDDFADKQQKTEEPVKPEKNSPNHQGDYIDFEEVK